MSVNNKIDRRIEAEKLQIETFIEMELDELWAKGLTWYFGVNLCTGPLFEAPLLKAWENFGRGRNMC